MHVGKNTTIAELAKLLERRKHTDQRTVLILGSRAGALFQSTSFYTSLQNVSEHDLTSLTPKDRFAACYNLLLANSTFSRAETDTITQRSLQELKITSGYTYLAELIRRGYFSTIITTNIDNLLELALSQVGMNEARDYNIFTPERVKSTENNQSSKIHIYKAFGDFRSKDYCIGREATSEEHLKKLQNLLKNVFIRDIVIVGYDPVWDQALIPALPPQIGSVSFVNEDEPSETNPIFPILQSNPTTTITGEIGNYEPFTRMLYWHLLRSQESFSPIPDLSSQLQNLRGTIEDIWNQDISHQHDPSSLTEEQITSSELDQPEEASIAQPTPLETDGKARNKVFICYSHEDIKYLRRLKTHLDSLGKKNPIEYWDDTKIQAGACWQKEIEYALQTAKVAVLLVSPDLLASKFILENELPPLLRAAESEGTIILPVIISPCLFQESLLGQFQSINPPNKPLDQLTRSARDQVWVTLVRFIVDTLNNWSHSSLPVYNRYQ